MTLEIISHDTVRAVARVFVHASVRICYVENAGNSSVALSHRYTGLRIYDTLGGR